MIGYHSAFSPSKVRHVPPRRDAFSVGPDTSYRATFTRPCGTIVRLGQPPSQATACPRSQDVRNSAYPAHSRDEASQVVGNLHQPSRTGLLLLGELFLALATINHESVIVAIQGPGSRRYFHLFNKFPFSDVGRTQPQIIPHTRRYIQASTTI